MGLGRLCLQHASLVVLVQVIPGPDVQSHWSDGGPPSPPCLHTEPMAFSTAALPLHPLMPTQGPGPQVPSATGNSRQGGRMLAQPGPLWPLPASPASCALHGPQSSCLGFLTLQPLGCNHPGAGCLLHPGPLPPPHSLRSYSRFHPPGLHFLGKDFLLFLRT